MSAKSAGRYAKSLLDYAIELNKLEEVKSDMQLVASVCSESRDLELMLHSPIIKKARKVKVFTEVFSKHIQAVSLQFLTLVIEKSRENFVMDITAAFAQQYKAEKGIVTAQVTTARGMSEEQRKGIAEVLKSVGKVVELEEAVDADILGGMKVRVGDLRFDASLRKKLKELKQDISK